MKRCTRCGIAKPETHFGKQFDKKMRRSYLKAACRECLGEQEVKRREQETPEAKKLRKEKFLKRLYKITSDDYNALFEKQKGCCKGCGQHQNEFVKSLCVDHHHTTGKVRGLLCSGCNLAVGNVKDNPDTLRNLAKYLEE